MSRFWLVLLTLFTAVECRCFAGDNSWVKLTTQHFEMYTSNDPQSAAAVLQVFERAHDFFAQQHVIPVSNQSGPVKIVAFRSEQEYTPYRLHEGAFAYYLRNDRQDYIVMQDIAPEHYGAAIHEYTHLIVAHSGWKLPLWLNEGLAEVYSSLEIRDNQVILGHFPRGRLADLRNTAWLSMNAVVELDRNSPYYQQTDKMRTFYAQSWALCHMLFFSPAYRSKFIALVAAISAGKPAEECFRELYGKPAEQLGNELPAYLNQATPETMTLDAAVLGTTTPPVVSSLPAVDRNVAFADLLAVRPQTQGEARRILEQLAKTNPANAEAEESLGYLAWRQGNEAEARLHFRRAFENGSTNAAMLCAYASLIEATPEGHQTEGDSARAALLKAIALRPDYADARLQFALLEFRAGHYQVASSHLRQIKTVKPEQAYCYYTALAYSEYRLGQMQDARLAAVYAKEHANNAERLRHCVNLLATIDEK